MPPSHADIERCLRAARAGSAEALGRLLEAYRGLLLAIARRKIGPELNAKGSASDLVQETFLEAQRDFAQFRGHSEEELKAWLQHLLRNNLRDFTKTYAGTAKREVIREVSLEAVRGWGELGLLFSSDSASPRARAIKHEQAEAVQQALRRLPADYRHVLQLRYTEGRSFEEIGERMQRSANAARKLWLRALERMGEELEVPP
jgi:RNA polymerase sigma-70 factor (ECF subfamily)